MPITITRNVDGSLTLKGIIGDLVYELNDDTAHVEVAYQGATYDVPGSAYDDTIEAWHAGNSLGVMPAPVATGSLSNLTFEEGAGAQTVLAAPAFDATPGTYSVSPDDATVAINATTGVLTYYDNAHASATYTITKTNPAGSDNVAHDVEVTGAGVAPVITGVPTIAGVEEVGYTLTATAASVTGTPTPTRTWQWERSGTPIGGATSSTYVLQAADEGETLTVVQTETNASGSDNAESAATGTIAAAGSFLYDPVVTGLSVTATPGAGDTTFDATDTHTPSEESYDGASVVVADADLPKPSALWFPADVISDGGGGEKRVLRPLYVSNQPMTRTCTVKSAGVVVAGETGGVDPRVAQYSLRTPDDDGKTVTMEFDAATGFGSLAAPYIVTLQAGFTVVNLVLDENTVFNSAAFTALNADRVIVFESFVKPTSFGGDLWWNGGPDEAAILSSSCANELSGKKVVDTFGSSGDTLHMITTFDTSGAAPAGFEWQQCITNVSGTESLKNTSAVVGVDKALSGTDLIVHRAPAAGESITFTRCTIIHGVAVPDLSNATERADLKALFIDGATIQPPSVSEAEFGQAWFDLYGPAAYINGGANGRHLGTLNGGNFASMTGAITEV